MKNKWILISCLFCIGLFSCDNWLDVKPEMEKREDSMFKTQQGFQEALIGAYLHMKSDMAYGRNLMYGDIEFLAQHWDNNKKEMNKALSLYNYRDKDVKYSFSLIYAQLYTIIADVDAILENIEGKNIFENGMYEVIKGEALAIRAYCHFDLLRLFGPIPAKVKGGKVLPYVKTVSIAYHEHHTYEEYTSFLLEDLQAAEDLLKHADPIVAVNEDLHLSNSAMAFLEKRQIRMNYYAVKALEARFYLWLGGIENKSKAYLSAKEVKEAKDKTGKLLYTLGGLKSISDKDYAFSSEHIVAVYDYQLYSKAENNFKNTVVYSQKKSMVISDIYSLGTTDIRYTGLWTEVTMGNGDKFHVIKKYWQNDKEKGINQLPLLRLSELYFIMMECGTLDQANELYSEFCISRDIPLRLIDTPEQLTQLLIQEYNREFYGEGQAFFTYKRLNVSKILWSDVLGGEEVYVIPLPDAEINYHK